MRTSNALRMALYRQTLVILPFLFCCFAHPRAVSAETLAVPADALKSGFDYHTPYRGQTFMFTDRISADRLTVYATPNIFQSFTFRLLLTDVDTADGIHPVNVLYESPPFFIPLGAGNSLIPYTADLGGIELDAGRTYAFILDIFSQLSQIQTDLLWQYTTRTGMNADAVYAPGEYIYFAADCTDPWTGLPCGSREDHFAGTWIAEPAEDMGFILEYTPLAPPFVPAVIELLLLKK